MTAVVVVGTSVVVGVVAVVGIVVVVLAAAVVVVATTVVVVVVSAALGLPKPQLARASRVAAVRVRIVRMLAKVWPADDVSERARCDLDDSRRLPCLNPDGYGRWRA
jgi:hypothetical protein